MRFHSGPGVFLVFEGINGCGKSVQAVRLHNWLRSQRVATVLTKEPTTGFIGQQIRRALKSPALSQALGPAGLQSWYALDGLQHLREVVIPALRRGEVVISDRYRPSLVHSVLDEKDIATLLELNEQILAEEFIIPDITFIFDLAPETAIARLVKKGMELDLQETLPEITRTRRHYLELSSVWPKAPVVINAEQSEVDVFKEVQRHAADLLDPFERRTNLKRP